MWIPMDNLRINLHLSMIDSAKTEDHQPAKNNYQSFHNYPQIIPQTLVYQLATTPYPQHQQHTPYIKENQWFNDRE